MYKLMISSYNDDAGYYINNLIAISEDIDKLKIKAVDNAPSIWDEQWETETNSKNQIQYVLKLARNGDSYIISEEKPL